MSSDDAASAGGTAPAAGVRVCNWAATCAVTPGAFYTPASVADVCAIVRACAAARTPLRVVGAGHSPNDCAMSRAAMLSLRGVRRVLALDAAARSVSVEAGITLAELNEVLDAAGLALPNLGSISAQTLAGAIATGTHGTGVGLGVLSTAVTSLTLVDGRGELVEAAAGSPLLRAAACSLGALGVVVRATLAVVPAFDLAARECEVPLADALRDLPARAASAAYYRLWWFPHTGMAMEWRAERVPPLPALRPPRAGALAAARAWLVDSLFGFHALQAALLLAVLLPGLVPAINALWRRVLFAAPRARRDRSDRIFNFDCLFKQHVNEWALPAEAAPRALAAIDAALTRSGHRAHFPIEVRFVAADDAWLSPASGRASVFIGIIAYRPFGVDSAYAAYFAAFEGIMRELGGRPHWAKDFSLRGDAGFAQLYPRWADFKRLRAEMDPRGVFVNDFVRRTFGLPLPPQAEEGEAAAVAAR